MRVNWSLLYLQLFIFSVLKYGQKARWFLSFSFNALTLWQVLVYEIYELGNYEILFTMPCTVQIETLLMLTTNDFMRI